MSITLHTFWLCILVLFDSSVCFTLPGFQTREIKSYEEFGKHWRVLNFTFPEYITTHNKTQRFYFDDQFKLRRRDYVAEVVGDGSVKYYVYDYKVTQGLAFPCFEECGLFHLQLRRFSLIYSSLS
jgi:hypothetical protein